MPEQAPEPDVAATTGKLEAPHWQRWIVRVALVVVLIGVFATWTVDGSVRLNGIQGSNDGWLVAILAVLGFVWARMMERGALVGAAALVATSIVVGWTAIADWLDARETVGASAAHGLLLVVVGSLVLAATACACGMRLRREARGAAER